MKQQHTITGTLIFDPKDMTNKHMRQSEWKKTALILFDDDLCDYYAWFVQKRYNIKLNTPLRNSHLTIINDRVSDDKKYQYAKNTFKNRKVKVTFDPNIRTNGVHWWLKAFSEESKEIRKAAGLNPNPYFNFHLTIGYANEKNIEHSKYIHNLLINHGKEYN